MHDPGDSFDINISEVSKIEGAASLEIKVRNKKIEDLKFSISEWKRFYTQAIEGKPAQAAPQLVARICGTCSNAHLLCSIKAIENAYHLTSSNQTLKLRELLYHGLIIRDHALHLYIFSLPDIFQKNSILDFSEADENQKQLLADAFSVKEAGNLLSITVGGRSVHAPHPTIGGFLKLPQISDLKNLKNNLIEIRPKIIKLINIFTKPLLDIKPKTSLKYTALISDNFSYLYGKIKTNKGETIEEKDFRKHLNNVVIPYSHARGFNFDGDMFMVGALSRINLNKDNLNKKTKQAVFEELKLFPTDNIFHNNLAQAIEILHSIDTSLDIIDSISEVKSEPILKINPTTEVIGIGVIEAPRGTLYHKYEIDNEGRIKKGEIIVPTGQNQIFIEKSIFERVESLISDGSDQNTILSDSEKVIRAFDPCMSCATHFLKIKWK